jgi:UPF0755 protein
VIDERPDLTKARHRRPGEGRRPVIFALVALLLIAVAGGGAYVGYEHYFGVPDYDGAGSGAVPVVIADKSTLTDMGRVLVTDDVVKSVEAFTEAAAANPKSESIQSGTFTLRKQMSGAAAVTLLLDPKSRVSRGVTIPEGKTALQVYAILSKATDVPLADFTKAAKDPSKLGIPASWFTRDDGQKSTRSVEGFLFPDTYEFKPGTTATGMLEEMIKRFMTVATKIDFIDTVKAKRKITPYEALTVASLAQAEAGNTDDLGKVARVAYNRLYTDFPCGCLQFDVGINYYRQLTGKPVLASKDMTTAQLTDPANPYRLHGKAGLTPTPIDNPGQAGLSAAMDPPAGNWLYFVAIDKQGHSAFSQSYDEFLKNTETAKKNGVL